MHKVCCKIKKSNKMKITNKFATLALCMTLGLGFVACSDDDDDNNNPAPAAVNPAPSQQNIAEIAIGSGLTDSLVVALTHTNLVSVFQDPNANYTVFAPTNTAFAAYISATPGVNQITDLDTTALKNILLYHVLGSEVKSDMLSDNMYATSLNTESPDQDGTSMKINTTNGVVINNSAMVTAANNDASNGVVHIINDIITNKDVTELAINDDRFDSLVVALSTANLVNTVKTTQNITVFAPTNEAFVNLLGINTSWNKIADIRPTLLDSVLKYHVYGAGNVQSSELGPLDGTAISMLGSGNVTIDLTNGAQLKTATQTVDIIITDVQGTNGVIHAIDEVLLP